MRVIGMLMNREKMVRNYAIEPETYKVNKKGLKQLLVGHHSSIETLQKIVL